MFSSANSLDRAIVPKPAAPLRKKFLRVRSRWNSKRSMLSLPCDELIQIQQHAGRADPGRRIKMIVSVQIEWRQACGRLRVLLEYLLLSIEIARQGIYFSRTGSPGQTSPKSECQPR